MTREIPPDDRRATYAVLTDAGPRRPPSAASRSTSRPSSGCSRTSSPTRRPRSSCASGRACSRATTWPAGRSPRQPPRCRSAPSPGAARARPTASEQDRVDQRAGRAARRRRAGRSRSRRSRRARRSCASPGARSASPRARRRRRARARRSGTCAAVGRPGGAARRAGTVAAPAPASPCRRRSAGSTKSRKQTTTESGLPGSPNTSVRAAAAEPQRLAGLDPHAPEHLLDAAGLERGLDVVVRADRDAAGDDQHVARQAAPRPRRGSPRGRRRSTPWSTTSRAGALGEQRAPSARWTRGSGPARAARRAAAARCR